MNGGPEHDERVEAERVRLERPPPNYPELEAATLEHWLIAAEACLLHSEKWHYGTATRCPEAACLHDQLEPFVDLLSEQRLGWIVARIDSEVGRRRETVRHLRHTVAALPNSRRWMARCERSIERDGLSSGALWEAVVDKIIESVNRRAEDRAPARRRPLDDRYRDTEPDLWAVIVEKSVAGEDKDDEAPDIEDLGSASSGVGAMVADELLTPCYEVLAECAHRLLRRVDPWANQEMRSGLRWYSLDPTRNRSEDWQPEILQRASAQMTLARLMSVDRWRELMFAYQYHSAKKLKAGLSEGPVNDAIRRLDPLLAGNALEKQRSRTVGTVAVLLAQELSRMADSSDVQRWCAVWLAEVFDGVVSLLDVEAREHRDR